MNAGKNSYGASTLINNWYENRYEPSVRGQFASTIPKLVAGGPNRYEATSSELGRTSPCKRKAPEPDANWLKINSTTAPTDRKLTTYRHHYSPLKDRPVTSAMDFRSSAPLSSSIGSSSSSVQSPSSSSSFDLEAYRSRWTKQDQLYSRSYFAAQPNKKPR
eukprot:GILI01006218.1.p1 GENE.GILI01006218.1~~GILI01006218.1.p1  ORF type:complete len:161 (-),score=29.77 GILI01006218.1:395-877(-)